MKYIKKYESIFIFSFGFIFLLIIFLGWYYSDYENASNFGNTTIPLLSFFGSILVYFALKSQVKANKILQKQFKHGVLINSFENLNSRIINSSILIDKVQYSGYSIFSKILTDLRLEQEQWIEKFSIGIFTSIPEKISTKHFEHFLLAYSNELIIPEQLEQKAIELKEKLITEGKLSAVYLYDKFNINKHYDNSNDIEFILREKFKKSITDNYFYKTDGEFRMNIYELSFRPIDEKYDIFLDSYFKNVFSILEKVYKSKKNQKENKNYLQNIFTNHEKILLFHKLMTGNTTKQFAMYIIELEIFNMTLNKKFFAIPTRLNEYTIDIDYIKLLIHES